MHQKMLDLGIKIGQGNSEARWRYGIQTRPQKSRANSYDKPAMLA